MKIGPKRGMWPAHVWRWPTKHLNARNQPKWRIFRMLRPHGAKREPFARDFEKNKDLL